MSGYNPGFLGIDLPLPSVGPSREADVLVNDGSLDQGFLADYPNYAVVTDRRRRAPLYVVAHIDQKAFRHTTRSNHWLIDQRVGSEFQLDNAYYANNPWDKGHMAQRESAGWGKTTRVAQKSADETFYYSNATLQHENLNQDEWLALEIWVHDLELPRDGKITVFAGPVYGDFLRTIRPEGRAQADIPSGFFKVVCFVNAETQALDVRAFYMLQDQTSMRDKDGRDTFEFQNYQVTITEIESLTGLTFPPGVAEANPLFFNDDELPRRSGATSFPERIDIDRPADIITRHDQPRVVVRDDQVEVYIAAASVNPPAGEDEWVSLINLEHHEVSIEGWSLVDRENRVKTLDGVLTPGQARTFRGQAGLAPVRLPNDGGVLTLLDENGQRIDRADYNSKDIARVSRKKGKPVPLIFFTYREKQPTARV